MTDHRVQSIERTTGAVVVVCALLVAAVVAAVSAFSGRSGDTVLATLYRSDGTRVAAAQGLSNGGVVCRTIGGNTICLEPVARGASLQRIATTSSIAFVAALLIGGIAAFALTRSIARRVGAMRVALRMAVDDHTSSMRMPAVGGALGELSVTANRLLDEMQQRDITLRRRSAELEEANKDLESFASAVSHDLRGPLGSITGFAQALTEDYVGSLDEAAQECVHWIRDGCEQMRALIEGLLQVSRMSRAEIRREEVDLSTIARQIADSLRRAHPERDVDFAIADDVVANGDERMLRAVMENLIGNAWKFTGKRPDARIEIGVRNEDGHPAYFVRDNGAGFDPAHAAKMFRPFQRLHSENEFSGTGIGLATVQKIVQRHGGRAWAEGEPNRGATIYFTVS